MVEYYNNTLTLEASWLVENDVITESNYKKMTTRQQIQVLRRGCLNTPALVAYDSMPERFKRKVVEVIGRSPYEVVKINWLQEFIRDDIKISDFFRDHTFDDGRHIPEKTQREYYINTIILDAIGRFIVDKRAVRSAKGHKTTGIWTSIADSVLNLDRLRYPHSLPLNPRRLEEKYKKYRKEGEISLVHKNFLNKNASRVDDEIKESALMVLFAQFNNYDNVQIANAYNELAERYGWKDITPGTVAKWRKKYNLETYPLRRGTTAFRNKMGMQVKRSAPSRPLYYVTLDGWKAELWYNKHIVKENGYTAVTSSNRVTIVVVLDPCCKYPLGYAIGEQENAELVKTAFRNALKHTEELFGAMHRPHQVQTDNFGNKFIKEFCDEIGGYFTPARAYNAKAKVIEPFFKDFNKRCQYFPNWSGYGITTDPDKQPNVEFKNTIKKTFPDYDGVCAQLQFIIDRMRADSRDEYLKLWSETEQNDRIELSYANYLLQFGSTTGRTILMQHSGIIPTINGVKHYYDCFDIKFRRHTSVKWNILYDPDNMEKVLAVNEDQSLQFILEEKHIQPMALKDRQIGDSEQLQRVHNFNKELEADIAKRISEAQVIAGDLLREIPQINEANRFMLTDSNGQHKIHTYGDKETEIKVLPKMIKAKKSKLEVSEVKEVTDFGYLDKL